MSRRRTILLALLGLIAVAAASIPLIRQLSVELVQLQIRERFLDGRQTLAQFARDQEVPEAYLIERLGLAAIPRAELARLTLAGIAARRGQSVRAFKRDLLDAAFERQIREDNAWAAWFARATDGSRRDD